MSPTMQVMVGLSVAYAAKIGGGTIANYAEQHLLQPGAIAIFDEQNNLMTAATVAADVAKVQKFYIVQGMSNPAQNPKKCIPIDRDAYTQAFGAYVAPVLQVSKIGKVATVGVTGFPASPLNDTFASVIVTNTGGRGYEANQTKRYTTAVTTADTVITVMARLVVLINADVDSLVTAAAVADVNNDAIVLTAKSADTSFLIGVDDVLAFATRSEHGVNGSVDGFAGRGTIGQVKANLIEDSIVRGNEYRLFNSAQPDGVGYYAYPDVLEGNTTSTFSTWTFQWKEETNRVASTLQTANPLVLLHLVTGAAQIATLATIFAVLLLAPTTEGGANEAGDSSGEALTVAPVPAGGEG